MKSCCMIAPVGLCMYIQHIVLSTSCKTKVAGGFFFVKLTVNCDTNRLSALSAFDCWLLRSLVWTSTQYHSPACVVCMFERAALVILLRSCLDCDAVREELCSQEASMCLEMACTEIEFWGLCMWACFFWALCSVGRSQWCSVRVLYF